METALQPYDSMQEYRTSLCTSAGFARVNDRCALHVYPTLQEDPIATASRTWDACIDPGTVLAVVDTSLLHDMCYGTIFAAHGAYYRDVQLHNGVFYYNYTDIENFAIKKANPWTSGRHGTSLVLHFRDGRKLEYAWSTFYDKHALKQTLETLRDAASSFACTIPPRETGWVKKRWMDADEASQCHTIIHAAATASAITSAGEVQTKMVEKLAAVFSVPMTDPGARALRDSLIGKFAATASNVSRVFLGWLPKGTNILDLAVQAGATEAIGWAAVAYFVSWEPEKPGAGTPVCGMVPVPEALPEPRT